MKEEYNQIPVYYCKHCLSLAIQSLPDGTDYCVKCGGTDIDIGTIEEWNLLYTKFKFKQGNGNSKK